MKTNFLLLSSLILLVLSGCESSPLATQTNVVPSTSTPVASAIPTPQPKNISFEMTSFTMDYEDTTNGNSEYTSERFTGTGIINAIGDEALIKKPYMVLIDVKKVSGGDTGDGSTGSRVVLVTNGIGTFNTGDSQFKKNATRLVKPVYDVTITGFLPFEELPKK